MIYTCKEVRRDIGRIFSGKMTDKIRDLVTIEQREVLLSRILDHIIENSCRRCIDFYCTKRNKNLRKGSRRKS